MDGSDIEMKAVRFIPLDSVVQPCMRVQICGKCKPYFVTVYHKIAVNID